MKMVGTMQKMVENNKIVMSGDTGEQLLSFFKDTTDLVNMAKIEWVIHRTHSFSLYKSWHIKNHNIQFIAVIHI